jgi:hypothetical protein
MDGGDFAMSPAGKRGSGKTDGRQREEQANN